MFGLKNRNVIMTTILAINYRIHVSIECNKYVNSLFIIAVFGTKKSSVTLAQKAWILVAYFFDAFCAVTTIVTPMHQSHLGATGQDVSSSKIRLVSPVQAAKAAEAEDA